jgi:hypothetical protein
MDTDYLEVFHAVRGLLVNLRHKFDLHRAVANQQFIKKE